MFGESAGCTPFGSIGLFWICGGAHCTVMALAYHAVPDTGENGGFEWLFPHLLIAGYINTCLAFLACEARRKGFLVTRMRVEQLSREKERLEYERQFAETKLQNSLHASGFCCGDDAAETLTPEACPGSSQQPAPSRPSLHPPCRSVFSEPSSASDIELAELNTLPEAMPDRLKVQFRVPCRR